MFIDFLTLVMVNLVAGTVLLAYYLWRVVDVFDSVCVKRPYRDAVGFDEAFAILNEGRGSAFDPDLVDVLKFCRARFREIYDKHRD